MGLRLLMMRARIEGTLQKDLYLQGCLPELLLSAAALQMLADQHSDLILVSLQL